MKILRVENHGTFVRVANQHFLKPHTLTITPTVWEAIARLSSESFDLIILDFDLDDGKGTEVLDFLRTLPKAPPVIAASSHTEGNNAMLAAGAKGVCTKHQFAEIEKVIATVWNGKSVYTQFL